MEIQVEVSEFPQCVITTVKSPLDEIVIESFD